MAKSIIQHTKECYLCGTAQDLELHHCLCGTSKRSLADEDGLTVYLCHFHHTGSSRESVHMNHFVMEQFQQKAQTAYEQQIGTREEFIKRYGENYL